MHVKYYTTYVFLLMSTKPNTAYDNEEYDKAFAYFELANRIRYSDILAIFAGYVAQLGENDEGMISQYMLVIESEADSLPENAKDYINKIEDFLHIPVGWIGVGQARDAVIIRT